MAIQQLTQPVINPISAFDATRKQAIKFSSIGGAQVIGNRLVVRNNQTGEIIYDKIQSTMKFEHNLPANSLSNNNFYNAVIYTIDNSNNQSVASIPVPFYCYTQPALTIDNIPSNGVVENGTYSFEGSYVQNEGELLDSYKFILYDSNKAILAQSPLIYYGADPSLTYLFAGMSNNTSYYIELTGETVNNTIITSGVKSFSVRYIQPTSFAICDLSNSCEDGYIQISSNIIAIDGTSNPSPPIYIDDKEVDLRDPDSWVEWNTGFNIKDDFTLRAWGRDFNEYEKIITLKNQLDDTENPNKIEMKWMVADILKDLPYYVEISGKNINLKDSKAEPIKNIYVGGNTIQSIVDTETVSPNSPISVLSLGDINNIINVSDFNITYTKGYSSETNTNYAIKPNFLYTLSFYYTINSASTDVYFSIGYGVDSYEHDINSTIQYVNNTEGRNIYTFIAPSAIPEGNTLWVKFAKTIIQADVDIDIRNVQLENKGIVSDYQQQGLYNIRLRTSKKNLFNYKTPFYILTKNVSLNDIQNGYNIEPVVMNEESYLGIGWQNTLNLNKTYAVSYFLLGEFDKFELYSTKKGEETIIEKIDVSNGVFTTPNYVCDLQLRFYVNSNSEENSLQIWNIQIEDNDIVTEFEVYEEEGKDLTFNAEINAIGKYLDLICLESPNILNPDTLKAKVEKSSYYILSQSGNITCKINFINEDGNLIKQEEYVSGVFQTQDNCVELQFVDITSEDILNNEVQITKSESIYYPYVNSPSLIKYIEKYKLTGDEQFTLKQLESGLYQFSFPISDLRIDTTKNEIHILSKYFKGVPYSQISDNTICSSYETQTCIITTSLFTTIDEFKAWITSKDDIYVYYVLQNPVSAILDEKNTAILGEYSTYSPITNIFVNNNIQANLQLDYANDYAKQETQNVYIILRCYNNNKLPYIIHSNYIDIPKETDKVFIWVRRENNIFDLKIENLGDYNEPEHPDDPDKPVVSLEIKDSDITSDSITVTASSVDNYGLTTVRFSKNNGDTWDEIVTVDGLSSINTYTFTGLIPNTLYTIRVEAIDIDDNVGGISQQVRTKI